MHQSEHPEFESFISFTCPTCNSLNRDVIGVPTIERRPQGLAATVGEQEQAYICGRCLQQFRFNVRNLGNRVVVQLTDFPDTKVSASQAYWSEEVEAAGLDLDDLARSPYDTFIGTVEDVLEVIKSPHAEFFGRTLARMAVIQLFAAIEAFLSDTLLTRVLDDQDRLGRLLAGVKDLQVIKLPLADILADPDIVRRTVSETIHKMSFHNFAKADAIWNVAFGHSIFKDDATKGHLLRYVAIRHDCVHRNGKTEGGVEREEVDFHLVREVAHRFEGTVLHIEGRFEGEDFEAGMLDENPLE